MSTRLWEENIRKVVPYIAGEQPKGANIIKLNTNENPYPPSKMVAEAIHEMKINNLRLYPDMNMTILIKELSNYYNVAEENLFAGIGSDDVLSIAFQTFFNSKKPILFPDITYSFYPVWADLYRIPYETPALDSGFHIIREDYYKENGGVIFPNPNAPTAVCESLEMIEDVVKHNSNVIVVIDEAYIDFGGESAIPLTKRYENLLVIQTFSKSRSMAGMRIGFAVGNERLIRAMKDIKFSINSYTLNPLSICAGAAAVRDDSYFRETVEQIIATRKKSKEQLESLGFHMTDSKANFLFASHETYLAKEIFEYLKEQEIYVRYWDKPRISNYLRITVGTDEQMEKLYQTLKEYIR